MPRLPSRHTKQAHIFLPIPISCLPFPLYPTPHIPHKAAVVVVACISTNRVVPLLWRDVTCPSVESGKSDDSGAGSSFGRGRGSGESDGSAEVPGGGPAASSTLMTQQQRNEGTHGDVRDSKAKDDRQDEKQRQQREEMNAAIYGDLLEAGDEDDVFGSRSDFGSLFAGKGRGSDGGKWKRRVASSECSTSDGEADYDDAMGNVDMKEDEGESVELLFVLGSYGPLL